MIKKAKKGDFGRGWRKTVSGIAGLQDELAKSDR